jgi:hypothetical protein
MKRILATVLLVCLFLIVGCGGSKYADCIELNEEFVNSCASWRSMWLLWKRLLVPRRSPQP